MKPDINGLELTVNHYAARPDFLNLELHYVIAESEDIFRFAGWQEIPGKNEQKFYCFLQEKELYLPGEGIVLKESYALTTEPIYPVVKDCKDFLQIIKGVQQKKAGKAIRHFSMEDLETIKKDLEDEFDKVETHVVASPKLQHHIFVVDNVEISVAPTMVYFRIKAPFSEHHYQTAKED
jgi:hypothetical protein